MSLTSVSNGCLFFFISFLFSFFFPLLIAKDKARGGSDALLAKGRRAEGEEQLQVYNMG